MNFFPLNSYRKHRRSYRPQLSRACMSLHLQFLLSGPPIPLPDLQTPTPSAVRPTLPFLLLRSFLLSPFCVSTLYIQIPMSIHDTDCNHVFIRLYPDPVMGRSLRTGGPSHSSLPLQLQCSGVRNTGFTRCTLAGRLLRIPRRETGCRESWPVLVNSAEWRGWCWCPQSFLPWNKERSMSREDGTPPPHGPRREVKAACVRALIGFSLPLRGEHS